MDISNFPQSVRSVINIHTSYTDLIYSSFATLERSVQGVKRVNVIIRTDHLSKPTVQRNVEY